MRKPHTYWDEGIELVSGCTPCSPGCLYCWSAGMTHRFGDAALTYIDPEYNCPRFTGKVIFHPDRLDRFNKKKPTVFSIWNDLFHESIDELDKAATYGTIEENPQHTYLILTKRLQNIVSFIKGADMFWNSPKYRWHGLTICNQQEADEKIPIFLKVPGKKFLSIEPILEEIKLRGFDGKIYCPWLDSVAWPVLIDAVILGCETGVKARPMNLDWARQIAEQCKAANVPLFIKALTINGKPNHNIGQWPVDLQKRELAW